MTVHLTRKSGQILKIPLDDILNITFQEEQKSVLDIPANCRVITDNDFGKDSPEVFFTLKLAHENKLDLAESIQTFNPDPEHLPLKIAADWTYVYKAAIGMNVPALTKGSQRKMVAPAGGKIE